MPGAATLVSRDNTHKNDQPSEVHNTPFTLRKGLSFSKDSDTVANPSMREFGEGASS